jgi:predicted ATPase/transcriptional regulator with XRE-family HTH domain
MQPDAASITEAKRLGSLIRRYRQAIGLSQEELAERVVPALGHNTISDVERGRTRPHRHTLDALATALGLDEQQRAELLLSWRTSGETGTSEPRPHHNLPAQSTSLVGRQRELAATSARLRAPGVRLLTLTGTGGIGKTRLALQTAMNVLEEYADGVFFISLVDVDDQLLVVRAVAQAVGVPDAGGNLRETLLDFLQDKHMLLVLDNCEHLLKSAGLIAELLAEASRLKILVTSREPLHLSGEQMLEVPPLQLPTRSVAELAELRNYEGVRLFIERAHSVKTDFELNVENMASVAEICHRLDGLPLAIELAAARVRHLTPQALLPRLQRSLAVLIGGAVDWPVRHQTLRSTIAWSYDLLGPAEQMLFRRLSVFAGGFTLDAAEAVCAPDGIACISARVRVLDGVASLVDKHLVRAVTNTGSEPRFSMLQTVREFGLEELSAADEERQVRNRHAAYYEALVQQAAPRFLTAEQITWLATIDDELDNVRAVLQWHLDNDLHQRGQLLAGSLWFFWSIHGHVSEGREWLAHFLDGSAGRATSANIRSRALLALGLTAHRQYDLDAARAAFAESVVLARRAGDSQLTAMALTRLAVAMDTSALWKPSDCAVRPSTGADIAPDPGELYREAVAILRRLGDRWGTAMCLPFYAKFYALKDSLRARELASEAVWLAETIGERWALGQAYAQVSQLAVDARELTRARLFAEKSLALHDELNVGNKLARLAQLELEGDEPHFAEALVLHERRLAKFRLLGNRPWLAQTLHDVGLAARRVGDLGRAEQALVEALALYKALGQRIESAMVGASMGHIYAQCGDRGEASRLFTAALKDLRDGNSELGVATALCGVGLLLLDDRRDEEAFRLLGASETLLKRLRESPRGRELNPSQQSPARYQFHRDTLHVLELRGVCARQFAGAFDESRVAHEPEAVCSLTTAHAIELALRWLGCDPDSW